MKSFVSVIDTSIGETALFTLNWARMLSFYYKYFLHFRIRRFSDIQVFIRKIRICLEYWQENWDYIFFASDAIIG
jgi:hypothetical protein